MNRTWRLISAQTRRPCAAACSAAGRSVDDNGPSGPPTVSARGAPSAGAGAPERPGRSGRTSASARCAAYDTDAYGNTLIFKDYGGDSTWFTDDDTTDNNPKCAFIFTGRRYDPETQTYFYRARYYHPATGRFLSRDPIPHAGGMGLYRYVGSSPLVAADPLGPQTATDLETARKSIKIAQDLAPAVPVIVQLVPKAVPALVLVGKAGGVVGATGVATVATTTLLVTLEQMAVEIPRLSTWIATGGLAREFANSVGGTRLVSPKIQWLPRPIVRLGRTYQRFLGIAGAVAKEAEKVRKQDSCCVCWPYFAAAMQKATKILGPGDWPQPLLFSSHLQAAYHEKMLGHKLHVDIINIWREYHGKKTRLTYDQCNHLQETLGFCRKVKGQRGHLHKCVNSMTGYRTCKPSTLQMMRKWISLSKRLVKARDGLGKSRLGRRPRFP